MRSAAELDALASAIIAAAIAVHRAIGPGCFESAYVPCLAYEFQKRNLDFARKVAVPLVYEELRVERAFVPDFNVGGCIIVEVKATAATTALDAAQLRTYLRLSVCPLGLLLNFGAARMKDGILRQVNTFPHGSRPGR